MPPSFRVYVDSPLAVNATEVHRLHPECFNESIYAHLREEGQPFEMRNLTYHPEPGTFWKQLNELRVR